MTPFLSFAITPPSLTPTFSIGHKCLLWGCEIVSVLTSWTRRGSFCCPGRPCRSCLQQSQGSVCWSLGAPHKPGSPAPSQWEQTGFQRPGVWHLTHLFPAVLVQAQKMPSLSSESLKANFKLPGTIVCSNLGWPVLLCIFRAGVLLECYKSCLNSTCVGISCCAKIVSAETPT